MVETTEQNDIQEMIQAWDWIQTVIRYRFPGATDNQVYKYTIDAFDNVLGLGGGLYMASFQLLKNQTSSLEI